MNPKWKVCLNSEIPENIFTAHAFFVLKFFLEEVAFMKLLFYQCLKTLKHEKDWPLPLPTVHPNSLATEDPLWPVLAGHQLSTVNVTLRGSSNCHIVRWLWWTPREAVTFTFHIALLWGPLQSNILKVTCGVMTSNPEDMCTEDTMRQVFCMADWDGAWP